MSSSTNLIKLIRIQCCHLLAQLLVVPPASLRSLECTATGTGTTGTGTGSGSCQWQHACFAVGLASRTTFIVLRPLCKQINSQTRPWAHPTAACLQLAHANCGFTFESCGIGGTASCNKQAAVATRRHRIPILPWQLARRAYRAGWRARSSTAGTEAFERHGHTL